MLRESDSSISIARKIHKNPSFFDRSFAQGSRIFLIFFFTLQKKKIVRTIQEPTFTYYLKRDKCKFFFEFIHTYI